jgi:hypothetical protein
MTIGLNRQEAEQDLLSQLRGGEHRLYLGDALAVAEAVARVIEHNNQRLKQDLRRLGLLRAADEPST